MFIKTKSLKKIKAISLALLRMDLRMDSQPACSKLTIETLEQGMKYVQR